jgi:hypothetical protein
MRICLIGPDSRGETRAPGRPARRRCSPSWSASSCASPTTWSGPGAPGSTSAAATTACFYAGDLARRLGVLDLVEDCFGLPFDDWELTLAGADTETAAMRQSAALTVEAIAGGDPRLRSGWSGLLRRARARVVRTRSGPTAPSGKR